MVENQGWKPRKRRVATVVASCFLVCALLGSALPAQKPAGSQKDRSHQETPKKPGSMWQTPGQASGDVTVHRLVVREDGVLHQRRNHDVGVGERYVVEMVEGRGWLGVRMIDLTPELREHFGAEQQVGVLVSSVVADSPAQRAGLEVGDLLLSVDGEPAISSIALGRVIRRRGPGEEVALGVLRSGKKKTLRASLGDAEPAKSHMLVRAAPGTGSAAGAQGALESLQAICLTKEYQDRMARLGKIDWSSLERRLQDLERKLDRCESQVASKP